MKEQLIEYKTAVLAKEKGYPLVNRILTKESHQEEEIKNWIKLTPNKISSYIANGPGLFKDSLLYKGHITLDSFKDLPHQSLLQKWLREVHNCHVQVGLDHSPLYEDLPVKYIPYIWIIGKHESDYRESYTTYEEALEEGLYQALTLIK